MDSADRLLNRKLLPLIILLTFFFLEWLAASHSASLLLQRKALFYSSDKTEFQARLKKALQHDPDNGSTHLYLASLYMNQKEYLPAREETKLALKYFASITSYNQLGSINLKMGNLNDAREFFSRVLRLYPEEKNARLRLAALCLSLHETEKARRNIKIFLQSHPGDPNGYYFLGMIQFSQNESPKALANFSKADRLVLESNPKLLFQLDDLYYRMAIAETDLRMWDACETHLKKALALNSRVSYVQALSDVYVIQKQFERAKNVLEKGVRRHPHQEELKISLLRLQKIMKEERKQDP